jgi:nicotinate phosphoribosyltransferase
MSHKYLVSVLDNDLYKFTMGYAIQQHFGLKDVTYEFKCRKPIIDWRPYLDEIKEAIMAMSDLHLTDEEGLYLESLNLFDKPYIESLKRDIFNPFAHITVHIDTEKQLRIRIHGPWALTVLYEVPILAIVNQVYADHIKPNAQLADGRLRADIARRAFDRHFRFVDFGTRRRRSLEWQEYVIQSYKPLENLLGTSNVYLAKKYKIPAIGTMAHEWIMAGQVFAPSLRESQSFMLQTWQDTYRGKLGIALSDTLGSKAFFKDFDGYFARLYDGVRQDSGDPKEFAEAILAHYRRLGINPKHKTIVFSDGLDMEKALWLHNEFQDEFGRVIFGIGTKLTNDFDYPEGPLNIVIKLTEVCGKPVAKISDSPGKGMCQDDNYLAELKRTFDIP